MDSLTYRLFLIHLFDLSFFIFLWVVINFDLNQERGVEMFNGFREGLILSQLWLKSQKKARESVRQTLIWEFTKEMMENCF